MRQHVGILLTAIAVLILLVLHTLIYNIIALIVYIIGIIIILIPQKERRVEERPLAVPQPKPTPEELKKRPTQPPEL